MNCKSTSALAEGGKAIAISVGLGLLLVFLAPFSILVVPLLPLASMLMAVRRGMAASLLSAAAAGAATAALIYLLFIAQMDTAGALTVALAAGLLVLLLCSVAGGGGGVLLRRGVSQGRLMAAMAGLFLVVMAVWGALLLVAVGMGPVAALQNLTDQIVQGTRDMFVSTFGADSGGSYLQDFQDMMSLLPYLLPALLPVIAVAFAVVNVLVGRRVFDRMKQPFPHDMSFRDFRLHYGFIYVVSAGIVCELYAYFVNDAGSVVDLVGMNLLILSLGLYFVQGLAVTHFFLSHFKVARPWRVAAYLGLIAMQGVALIVSWLGLFDAGLDYRRRFKRKHMQSQNR